jgi:hypothetical protein
VAAEFIAKFLPGKTAYLSNPTWGNHKVRACLHSDSMLCGTFPTKLPMASVHSARLLLAPHCILCSLLNTLDVQLAEGVAALAWEQAMLKEPLMCAAAQNIVDAGAGWK